MSLKMKTTKLEPPDGGWGILVCIGMAMPFISALASSSSFGLVFGDFLQNIGEGTGAIAILTSCFYCAFSFAGLFSSSLFQRFGLRTIGLIGGWLFFIGSLLQIFVRSTTELLIAYSLLQGSAFGLMLPTSYTTFNNYFVKKRVMWMSFAQSLIGVGTMFYPVAMQKLLELYGFRGCLIVLAAINAHAILGMLLMQPVEWHMVKVNVMAHELKEMEPMTKMDNKITKEKEAMVSAITTTTTTPPASQANYNSNNETDTKTDADTIAEAAADATALINNSNNLTSQRSLRKFSKDEQSMRSLRSSSITSLGNWSGAIVPIDASPEFCHTLPKRDENATEQQMPLIKRSLWQLTVDFLDLSLMKKPIYVNIALGMSFALYSDIAFFALQPLYLFNLNFDKPETASIIAIGAAADLASRVFLAFSAIFVQVPSRYIYLAGSFFTVIARFAFLNVFNFTGMAAMTAVLGFLRTWVHVPLPLVLADYLPHERFSSGYGLFMFIQGNIMFIIGPAVGYLRDITGNYELAFHCINFFMALCAFPWLFELFYMKIRKSRKRVRVANDAPATIEAAN